MDFCFEIIEDALSNKVIWSWTAILVNVVYSDCITESNFPPDHVTSPSVWTEFYFHTIMDYFI